MEKTLLPLFPLQVVLLPGGELPLHIFEDRYREMIAEVLRENLEFGVVLAGEKGIVNTGCTASIDQVIKEYPDGRLDIMTRGRRRFEILLLNQERAFLRGAVDFFDDDQSEPPSDELQLRAIEAYNALQALTSSQPLDAASVPRLQLSFRLAQELPDLDFRQLLLSTRSEGERLRRLTEYLPDFLMKQRRARHLKDLAPRNGHGHIDIQ